MIDPLRIWFEGRSLREKRLLLVMAALLVLTIVWAGIIRPVSDGLAGARERHANAVVRLAETKERLDQLHDSQRSRPAPLTGSLADAVRASAANAGFALSSLDEEGADRVRIGIQSARPGAMLAWVADLEAQGILVDSLGATNNGDRTVGVTATLKARGI